MSPKDFLLILVNVVLTVSGQLLLKQGMTQVGRISGVGTALASFAKTFTNIYVLAGLGVYGFTSMIWLVVLSRVRLSIAYPMISMGYVLSILASWLIFKEQVPATRILGGVVICVGVYMVSLN